MKLLGGLRAVEEVRSGDMVWAFDLVSGSWRPCRVIQTFSPEYEGHSAFVTAAGEEIESTLVHPYWVLRGEGLAERPRREHLHGRRSGARRRAGGWTRATCTSATRCCCAAAGPLRSRPWPVAPYRGLVYNFQVAELACYCVGRNGVLVHNISGGEAQSPPIIDNLERINKEWMEAQREFTEATAHGETMRAAEAQVDMNQLQAEWEQEIGARFDNPPPPAPPGPSPYDRY